MVGKSFLPLGSGFPSIRSDKDLHHLHFRSSFSLPSFILSEYTYFHKGKFLEALGLSYLVKWGWVLWGPFTLSATQRDGMISRANTGSWTFSFLLLCPSPTFLKSSSPFFLLSGLPHRCGPKRARRGSFEPLPPISEEWLWFWPGLWPGASLWGLLSQFLCL